MSSLLFLMFGFKSDGLSLLQYSIGIVYLCFAIIGETVVLALMSKICSGKKWVYAVCLAGLAIGGFVLVQINSQISAVSNQALSFLFGVSEYTVGVQETMPWTLSGAFANFNVSLILMAGGLLIIGYTFVKKRDHEVCFLLVWSFVMIFLTIHYQRFQLYLTIPVALLAAICIAEPLGWRQNEISTFITMRCSRFLPVHESQTGAQVTTPKKITPGIKRKKSSGASRDRNSPKEPVKDISFLMVIALTIILVVISSVQDYQYAMNVQQREIIPDWTASLNWMMNNTPDTGVSYFAAYNQTTFQYPPEAYGIMSWWDYGHWITFFAHRIPITNPFQNNLYGSNGAAAFFLSDNESNADSILESFKGTYVITDSNTAITVFSGILPWENGGSAEVSPYIKSGYLPSSQNPSQLLWSSRYADPYFQTMIVRLHIFDGSMTLPDTMTPDGAQAGPASVGTSGGRNTSTHLNENEGETSALQTSEVIVRY